MHAADPRFTGIAFSRNFGKNIAIAAGLRYARGDAVVVMDADLQHPPDVIPTFVARWREGSKIIFGQRQTRVAESALRNIYSHIFHAVFRRIASTRLPVGVADFLLLDRQAVEALNRLGERTRFSKGLYAWIGFPSEVVPFDAGERTSGESKWSFMKLAQLRARRLRLVLLRAAEGVVVRGPRDLAGRDRLCHLLPAPHASGSTPTFPASRR